MEFTFPSVIRRAHCALCLRSATDSETLPKVGRAVGKLAFAPPTPPQLTEVAVHIPNEQYQSTLTDQDSHDHDIDNDRPEQLHDKMNNLSFDNDLERGV